MDRVTPNLYVGSLADAGDVATLHDAGVETVIRLTHEIPSDAPTDPRVHARPMVDGPRNDAERFAAAARATVAALERGETTLVHCSAGASRSVSVAAAALAVHDGTDVREAFARVGAARDEADPHPALVRRAAAFVERA
jgi:protein-tyrosine phosphatase